MTSDDLKISIETDPRNAYADTWHPVRVQIHRPPNQQSPIQIRHIDTSDRNFSVNIDLFQRNLQIAPDETYSCTIYLKTPQRGDFDFANLYLQVENEIVAFPQQILTFRPSLRNELQITIDPICSYFDHDSVTKLQVTLKHTGSTPFGNLRVQFQPERLVRAGKQALVRQTFTGGDTETFMLAAIPGEISIHVSAIVEGVDVHFEKTFPVEAVLTRRTIPFRFLEPRKLSSDQITIRPRERNSLPIAQHRSAYPLSSKTHYEVTIRPQDLSVRGLDLEDVPDLIHVRTREQIPNEHAWRFEIEVGFNELWSHNDRIIYNAQTSSGTTSGQIHVRLHPSWWRRWRFAITLGIAVTVQGAVAAFRRFMNPESPLEEVVTDFQLERDYQLLLLLTIPACLILLWIVDRIRSRW
jgi:hypothetical protein